MSALKVHLQLQQRYRCKPQLLPRRCNSVPAHCGQAGCSVRLCSINPFVATRFSLQLFSKLVSLLREQGVDVLLEVNCPDRSARRLQGKSDRTYAQSAARMALCSKANIVLKSQTGAV
ncbi:MAG: hypothetical protein ABIR84_05810 [Candidatus Nitrotoga sp.]